MDNPFVSDVEEFINLLNDEEIDNEDKIDILSYTIKSNTNCYEKNG